MHYKIIRISRELFPKFLTLWISICRGGVLPAIINGYLFAYFSDPVSVCNVAGSELNGCYLCLVIVIIRNIKSRVRHAATGLLLADCPECWPLIGGDAAVVVTAGQSMQHMLQQMLMR